MVLTVLGTYIVNPLPSNSGKIDEIVQFTMAQKQETVAISPSDIAIGPADAPITLVKFSDFQCPACRKGAYAIHPLMERFPGKVRLIFKNFPLDPTCNAGVTSRGHPFACYAARIAICAHKQGKFEHVYRSFFDNQESFSEELLLKLGVEAGMPEAELKACMESSETAGALAKDISDGTQVKIESTPTFFMNGYRVSGAYPTTIWIALVEKLLGTK